MELTEGAPSLSQPNTSTVWKGQWMGVLGLACILAFSWIPNSYYVMVGWPGVLLWQVAFLLLGAWNVWAIRQFPVPFRLLGYGLDWSVGVILGVNIISALDAEFKAVALWNVLLLGNYAIVFYLLVNWLRQGLSQKYLWLALSLAGVVTSIVSLSYWRPTAAMWLSNDFYAALRNPLPLGHHNFVGGYELLLLPVTASVCCSQRGWKRGVGVGATLIVAIALYVSGSRGAMLGALAVVVIGTPLLLWLHRAQASRRWLLGGVVGLAIMLLIAASNPRIRALFNVTAGSQASQPSSVVITDGPARDRLYMLEAAEDIFSLHPLTGIGPGNLSRVYNLYRPLEVGNGLELVQQLHNTPAQLLAELGILGLLAYAGLLVSLLRLGIRLYGKISDSADRILFYGIFASYFGYGVSSLTDYQLENIGISSTLVIITALLVSLGDTYMSTASWAPAALSRQSRRWLSLGILTFLCLSFQLWARFDLGLYLSSSAIRNIAANNLVAADARWSTASSLVAWDPTYSALAAEQLTLLKPGADTAADRTALNQSAIDYLSAALVAAPNDTWLNQNLAVLLLEDNQPEKAELYARRASLLFPRNSNYTYYTLGSIYFQQGKVNQAITAFSLEGIINPEFLIANLWADPAFAPLLPAVLDKVLKSDRLILSQTNPASPNYAWVNEQLTMISWWYGRSLDGLNTSKIGPVAQTLLKMTAELESAASAIKRQNERYPDDPGLQLLQAWLSPDQYLEGYLKDFEGNQEEKDLLTRNIRQHRDLPSWMSSVQVGMPQRFRQGVGFAYRNLSANEIRQILVAGDLRMTFFPVLLGLFGEAPRIYPQLDQEISAIKTADLAIPPLSETRFQLPQK